MAQQKNATRFGIDPKSGKLALGRVQIPMPRSRMGRIATGSGLIAGGTLGFLPILGFWMLPLGVLVLSHDLPVVRRRRRRLSLWWARRRQARDQSRQETTTARQPVQPNSDANP